MQRRVILCAGHGGGDSGAVANGVTEAGQAIDIVNRTADHLRRDGQIEVIVVPHELGLVQSISWVNVRFKGPEDGLCLEIHKNSGAGNGVETWYFGGSAESARKAQAMQRELAALTGLPDRGIKPDTSNRFARLGWIRDTIPWALLLECGFMGRDHYDNDAYARAIGRGVLANFGILPREQTPPPAPAPTPDPPKVEWNYKVVAEPGGKQLGVYKEKPNVWNKYKSVNGAAKILARGGEDLTPQFVEEFRPKPIPSPHPDPSDQEREAKQDQEIQAVNSKLDRLIAWLKSVLPGFKE